MTSKQRRDALAVLATWPAATIRKSHNNPSPGMPASMIRLHRLAMRRMGAAL